MNWATKLFEQYRCKNGMVDACGVIIFTDAHPHIKKVLADEDYWTALDEISDTNWIILSVKPRQGIYQIPTMPSGVLGLLIPVWKEPKENKELIDTFGLDSTKDVPLLLIFVPDSEDGIVKFTLKLDDKTVESAYESLKDTVSKLTQIINRIAPENRMNADGIHQALSLQISSYQSLQRIKKAVSFWKWINDLMP